MINQLAGFRGIPFVAAWLAIATGVGFRIHLFLANRPLWLDEAWMSLRVLSSGFQKNAEIQTASPPFLVLERVAVQLFGHNEFALRALPLAAGICTLALVWKISARLLDTRGAFLATALVALAPILIRYSTEVKPYGLDALFAVAMIWVTLELLTTPKKLNWLRWLAVGTLAVLAAIPGVFLVLGSSVALLADRSLPERGKSRSIIVLSSAAWLGLFALLYLMHYRSTASSTFMQEYWTGALLEPRFPSIFSDAARAGKELFIQSLFVGAVRASLPPKTMYFVLILALLGSAMLARRRPAVLILLLAPSVLAAVASLLGHWPMVPRLLLFAVPSAAFLLAAGISSVGALLSSKGGKWGSRFAWLLVLAAIGPGLVGATLNALDPRPGWDFVSAIELLQGQAVSDFPVYIGGNAFVACQFYGWEPGDDSEEEVCRIGEARVIRGRFRPARRLAGADMEKWETEWAAREAARLCAVGPEAWFVFIGARRLPHVRDSGVRDNAIPQFLQMLEEGGARRLQEWLLDGAEIYKYEMAGNSKPPAMKRETPTTSTDCLD